MVAKELEGELARVICIFYVVLRALDTIEDDMTIPNSIKLPELRALHLKLHEPGWTFNQSNEKDKAVLENFDSIQAEFARLDPKYQSVIADICKKMGAGMADFAALATPETPVAEVNSIDDYDLYCHYVAGVVGEGLSGIFSASGKERPWLAQQLTLSNSMGMLLQKTNILRDIKEDVDEGRGFWPRAIWSKHGFNSMKELVDPVREKEALFAASEMTLDALRHVTDALDYMTLLKSQSVFNFVAIPAVMAIATLDRCFMNPLILKGNVKIRRGEAVMLMNKAVNPRDVSYVFREHTRSIHSKVAKDDPNLLKLSIACAKVEQWAEHHYPSFLEIQNTNGQARTAINTFSTDARVKLYSELQKIAMEAEAKKRREAVIKDLMDRGIIKTKENQTPAEYQKAEEARMKQLDADNETPWLMIIGVIVGMLTVIAAVGGGIVWVILRFVVEDTSLVSK